MFTTVELMFNTNQGLEKIEQRKNFVFFLFTITIISTLLIYLTLSDSIDRIVNSLNHQTYSNLRPSSIRSFMSIMIVIIGALFHIFTIATNSFLFYLAGKFFLSELTYKKLFKLFTYLYPLTILANIINFIPKHYFHLQTHIRLTSINAIFHFDGKIGLLLNGIDFFQIWTLVIVYFSLVKLGKMPKSSSLTVVISYFAITTLCSVFL